MKTNDFKTLIGMYNLEVEETEHMVFILKDGVTAATVSTTYQNCFNTFFLSMMAFCEPERQEIVDLIWGIRGNRCGSAKGREDGAAAVGCAVGKIGVLLLSKYSHRYNRNYDDYE